MTFTTDTLYRLTVFARSRRLSKHVLMGSVIALALFCHCHIASAFTFTFSQFQEASAASNPFVFNNAGAASTFSIVNEPVIFSYSVPNGYGLPNTPINGRLTMTSIVDGVSSLTGTHLEQALKDVHLFVTADAPVLGQDLLLEIYDAGLGSTAILDSRNNGHIAFESGDTTLGDSFAYRSDFLSFLYATQRDYSLSFSSVNPNFSQNGNGYLNSFTTAGTGTFAASFASVPEPMSSVLMILGGLGIFAFRRRFGSRTYSP